jgi:uncharacterized membrane protein
MNELLGIVFTVVFLAGAVVGWAVNSLTMSAGPWPPLDREDAA